MGARLQIRHAGPLVTVQDAGRPGLMRYGVPQSGAMDRLALAAANVALGRPAGGAAIEISPGGLSIECVEGETGFALAGGGFMTDHAGNRGGSWQRGRLASGEVLTIRPGRWGNWCYLAFSGQIAAPEWLGSRSTHSLSGLGGGRITTGQELMVTGTGALPRTGPIPCPVLARPRALIDIVPGPQQQFFDAGAREALVTAHWRISPSFDRMGLRLAGPGIAPAEALDIPSGPVLRGAIQVAGDGVPVVLMADHQSTGGYPRIATVIDPDLDAISRLRPNESLMFRTIAPRQAVDRARTHARAVQRYLATLALRAPGD